MTEPVATYDARHEALRTRLASGGIDALLVTHGPNLSYLTGLRASAGMALVTPSAVHLIVDARYITAARTLADAPGRPRDLSVNLVARSYDESVAEVIRAASCSRVGVEADHVTLARAEWLRRTFQTESVEIVAVEGLVERGRVVKDASEIERFRCAGALLSRVAEGIVGLVARGRSEREVAADIEHALLVSGFDDRAFPTIVASGPNSALPHARPSSRTLADGDLVLLDFGGVQEGYHVDISRTVCVGRPDTETRRLHAAVRDAQRAALDAVRPGVPASRIDAAARECLAAYNLAEAFGHATGHGLGLEIHEAPRIGRVGEPGTDALLEVGMVFTVEPGVYRPGMGGVRIEDDVVVTTDGCDLLTAGDRELRSCP